MRVTLLLLVGRLMCVMNSGERYAVLSVQTKGIQLEPAYSMAKQDPSKALGGR